MKRFREKNDTKGVGKIARIFAIDRNIPLEMIPLVFPLDNALPEDVETAKKLFILYRRVTPTTNSFLFNAI